MNDPKSSRLHSGRRVVLLVVFGVPLVVVPLLLSGPARERQVDLVTLRQRERTSFQIGSFRVREGDWQPVAGWPDAQGRVRVAAELLAPPTGDPAQWAANAYGHEPEPVWATTQRTMPFAFLVPIENRRAMAAGVRDVLTVKLAAASVLDSADDADRERLRQLDEALLEGLRERLAQTRRRRDRTPTAGEERAAELLSQLAALDATDRQHARAILGASD